MKDIFKETISRFKNPHMSDSDSTIYGNVDGLSLQNLFYTKYNVFPGCYLFDYDQREMSGNYFDVDKIYEYFSQNYAKEIRVIPYIYRTFKAAEVKETLSICVLLEDSHIFGRFQESITESYLLFDNEHYALARQIIDDLSKFYVSPELKKDTYRRLCFSSDRGFYLQDGKVKAPSVLDIPKVYNDDFLPEHERIENFITEKDKSGLIILHGEKGTGKSCYIKNLIHSHPEIKFVYVPAQIVTLITDPSFGSFLATLNNHVIVLEDCENAIRDRKNGDTAASVSLLLNMTDGILSDDLGIKFICTFNEDIKDIDEALLRKGRLVSKYEFTKLCPEKTAVLLDDLGYGVPENEGVHGMTLADIFHIEDPDYQPARGSYF